MFCVFIPIGLIGLIGLIAQGFLRERLIGLIVPIGPIGLIGLIVPIGLIALGFLRERLIGALGAASRRGSPLRGSGPFVCFPGVRAAVAALHPRLIKGRRFAASWPPRFARRNSVAPLTRR